jgi:TPR repeat protein
VPRAIRRFAALSLVLLAGLLLAQGDGAAKGKRYALLVGVKDYDHAKLSPLRFTENDVVELARLLSPAGYDVTLLTDSEGKKDAAKRPTGENVRRALQALMAKKAREDTVLVALAGHGVQLTVKEKDISFFCPKDAQLNDAETMLSLDRLFKDLDACGAGVKLLLVDACRNEPGARGRNLDVDNVPRPPRGTAALFSCASGQLAFETDKLPGGKGHGVFFYHVLEAMRSESLRNARGEVTWGRLVEHVTEKVSEAVPRLVGGGARQTPHEVKNIVGGSPVLVRGAPDGEQEYRKGRDLYVGLGVPVDKPAAAAHFLQAAGSGHALACSHLAVCYHEGRGAGKDEAEARRYAALALPGVKRLAGEGHAEAQWRLGTLYSRGLGVEKDEREAVGWYRRAALQGEAAAQNSLGWVYMQGLGVEKDYAEALRWCRLAADQGLASAQNNLGHMYMRGRGVKKDYAEAMRWCRLAADQGLPGAQNNIGALYQQGWGVKKDYAEALRWYRLAAATGYPRAQNNLGHAHFYGRGTGKDEAEAARWYKKAAEKGLAEAQFNLGWAYHKGRGVALDLAEAARWYRKAADQGHDGAKKNLASLR